MSCPSFSFVINHTPWRADRVAALDKMRDELVGAATVLVNDCDHRGRDWQGGAKLDWQVTQWAWSRAQKRSHHVFMTDDLHLAPNFLGILHAMVEANPSTPIGLLSNHPRAVETFDAGHHGYRTASWLVGPAYVLPHEIMNPFLAWFLAQPDERLRGPTSWNDDNSLNEFIATQWRGTTWHPLPTIVEHRADLPSTVGHGDKHSRERISWRERREVKILDERGGFSWFSYAWNGPSVDEMARPEYWQGEAPLLPVGE